MSIKKYEQSKEWKKKRNKLRPTDNYEVALFSAYSLTEEWGMEYDERAKRNGFLTRAELKERESQRMEKAKIARKEKLEKLRNAPFETRLMMAVARIGGISTVSKEERGIYMDTLSEAIVAVNLRKIIDKKV